MNVIECPLCLRRRRARFEYLEMVSALQRRIANQRRELARLQSFEQLYTAQLIAQGKNAPRIICTPENEEAARRFAGDCMEVSVHGKPENQR